MKARHQLATIAFFAANRGWHSYAPQMVSIVRRLAELGFLELSEATKQARFTGKVFV